MRRAARPWAALGALVLGACTLFPEDPPAEPSWPRPRAGVVVAEQPLAVRAGLDVLERGGNAADAAVATALALAVVYPQAGNLGGGGFALWVPHDPSGEPLCLDFRETAPRHLTADLFLGQDGAPVPERSLVGDLAVGVPGSPGGLWELHHRLGRLSLAEVAAPAIALARDGFRVDAWLARDLRRPDVRRKMERSAAALALFYPRDEPLAEGDLLRQPKLAHTLELLVSEGPHAFEQGEVAASMVGEMRRGGGVLDHSDLADYEPIWRRPLRGWFRGLEVLTVPPPSSGGLVLLQALAILDGFPLDQERRATLQALALENPATEASAPLGEDDAEVPEEPQGPGLSGRALHWWVEALRRGFADRTRHMGDPAFWDVPVQTLLSPSWIAERRTSIGELADPNVQPLPEERIEHTETTHLSVIDGDGNAVSLTTTLNTLFGCGVMLPESGFLLNDEIDDFSIVPGVPNEYGLVGSEANALQGGKRPLSSMTPTVVRDGGQVVRMVLGSPGGPKIISAVLQVILRTEVYGQSLADAVAAPRLHQQYVPPETFVEEGWEPRLLQGLKNRGHVLELSKERFGSVQAIRIVGTRIEGASDPRRGGAVGIQGEGVGPSARPPG